MRKFAPPKTDDEVVDARKAGVSIKIQKDTEQCFSIWKEWRRYRNEATDTLIALIEQLDKVQLNYWPTCFILEVKKKGDPTSEFPPNTLYHICYGIQCYLRWNGKPYIDFSNDKAFADFRSSLDAEMIRMQSAGIDSKQ